MAQTAYAHEALLPRAPSGNGVAALLALAVHAGLVAALAVAVDWRVHPAEVVSAELWASVPQLAAPPPAPAPIPAVVVPPAPVVVPPAPAIEVRPAEADIATERADRSKAEAARQQAEAERQRAAAERAKAEADAAEQRQARAAEERLARQREENLKRIIGQAGSAIGSAGTAAQDTAPSAAYSGRLAALIRGNSVYTGNLPDNEAAVVEVRAAASGTIIARRLIKSSGHADWDDAVLRAIDKTGTLPRDTDGRVPPLLTIAFRPRE